ncbi:hypothetical protein J6590_107882, partial [Homalodisca vitripennis]
MTNYYYLDKSKTDYLTYSRFDLLIFLSMCSRLIKEAMQNVVYVRKEKSKNNSANNAQDVQVNQKTPIMK